MTVVSVLVVARSCADVPAVRDMTANITPKLKLGMFDVSLGSAMYGV